ncbi:MAG: tRNA pseudouridine(13) synthase TruD, partial [Thermoplasmata archaeon]|nr:tRNA pseudouridine(13) synthase TruD [Thermoplasmata archaeon]
MYDESVIGIDVFLTKAKGVGGILRKEPEDFVVNEIPLKPEEVKDGFYTAALVRSRNWETNRLLRMCARKLRISRKGIYFAGTKDKRAVTTQLLVFSAPLQDVVSMNIRDVEVFEAYETDKRIQMGDLVGNEFEVAIRDITVPEEEIMERVESVRKDILDTGGFPNFFGVQRFGAVRPITHVVGKHIVLGEFDKAVHVYIANPIEGENEEAFEARKALEDTGDYSKALQTYPKTLSFEKAILNRLVKNEGDFIGALEQLPRNLLSMFIHSYQSYLFNKMLSQRIQGGAPLNEPLPGDLIMPIDK